MTNDAQNEKEKQFNRIAWDRAHRSAKRIEARLQRELWSNIASGAKPPEPAKLQEIETKLRMYREEAADLEMKRLKFEDSYYDVFKLNQSR